METKKDVTVDLVTANAVKGEVASTLKSSGALNFDRMRPILGDDGRSYYMQINGDPTKLENHKKIPIQTNATLRRDEWKVLDEAVLAAARNRVTGADDLESRGLVYNIGNAMASTVLEYHDINDALVADMSMDGLSRGDNDRVVYGTNYLPLPIIHVDFEINQRVLENSRALGNSLDTTQIEMGVRRIREKIDELLFTAASTAYTFGGGSIYGYLDEPNRNQVSLGTNWDASGKTGAQIITDVKNLKQASINDKHYGPWMLYIPTAYETKLDEDHTTGYPKSIRSRILESEGIEGVRVADTLTANNVVLVQMTSDTVRLVKGMPIKVVQWGQEGGLITKFKIMTIQVPQVRSDQNNTSGIVHLA